MAFDFKTAAPEVAISDSNLLFGAASFASANPTVFPVSTLRTLLLGGGTLNIPSGKTFSVTETMTLAALATGQTYTFPAASGTVALLNAANLFTTTNTFSPATDVAAGTFNRNSVSSTSNILQVQDEVNNNLAAFGPNGYLTLGRASGVTGQAVFANASNANTVTLKAGTTSSSWSLTLPISAGTANYVLTTDGAGASSWAQVSLTAGVTGTLPVDNGGTGQTTLAVHGLLVGNAASAINSLATGTAGQFLTSGGASADPAWTTATFPSTAGATGTILRSDGTNWVASSDTWPDTTAAGTILASASANTISATATPTLGVAGTTAGSLGLSGVTSGVVTINVAATAGTWSLTLPTSGGTNGYVLQTNGSGVSSWFNLFGTANTWSANQTFSAVALLADGTAAAPSLAFTNSATTGLYRYGANAIGVAINGAYAAQFDANGNLMVGTADDGAAGANNLTLAGSGNAGLTIRSGATSSGNLYFSKATTGAGEYDGYVSYNQTSSYMSLGTAATEHVRITSDGAVWPIINSTITSQSIKWGDGTAARAQMSGYYDSATAGHLEFHTMNAGLLTEWVRIPATGGLQLNGSTSGSTTVKAPAVAGSTTFQLPSSNGVNGYILTTDGLGATTWTDPALVGTDINVNVTAIVGGTSGRILYDNAGTVGEALLTYSAANLQLGAADAAAPVAQTLSTQSVVTGTANTAGVNMTIAGSKGTGTGAGGSIIVQTASAGTAGSTPNALSNAWAFDSNQTLYPAATLSTSMTKGFLNVPGGAGAPTGVPANTTGFPMYYDSTNNYLYVYNGAWKRVSFADNFLTQE